MKKFTLFSFSALFVLLLSTVAWAQTSIYSQDFEGTGLPTDWSQTSTASDGGWKFGTNTQLQSSSFPIPAHTKMACTNDDACNCDKSEDILASSVLDLSANAAVFMQFDAFFLHGYYDAQELAYVVVSTDGGNSWSTVYTLPGAGTWATYLVNLSAYAGNSNVTVGFKYDDGGGWGFGFALDNFSVFEPASADVFFSSINPAEGASSAYVPAGTSINLAGTINNYGASAITSFTVYYNDGTNTYSDTKTGLNIPSLGTYSFTHNTAYTVPATGDHPIKMWVDLGGDANHTNDTLNTTITGTIFTPVHTVTFEEATGTWCGWCVRGIIFMDSIAAVYPTTSIRIAVHNGDPMAVSTYDAGETSFPGFPGFPSVLIDRKVVDDPSLLFEEYDAHSGDFGFADLKVDPSFNSSTNKATVVASAHFAVDLEGDYRLACVFTEDDVTGTGSTWAQHNYYAGGQYGPMGGFEDMPGTIPASQMHYNFVARAIVGGYDGQAGSLPSTITGDQTYQYTFSYTVPSTDDPYQMKAIVLLINNQTGEIMNGAQADLLLTGINSATNPIAGIGVYPNPFSNSINVALTLNKTQPVTINVTDMLGRVIESIDEGTLAAGNHQIALNGNNLAAGVYFVTVKTVDGEVSKKVVKSE